MDRRWMLPLICAAVVWLARSLDARGVPGEDVVTLTHETFDQENGFDKGDLVELEYVPWCEYSKQLAPEYEKPAGTFKKIRNVLIAKISWGPDCGLEALTEFVNEEAGITTSSANPLFLLLANLLLA